MFPYFRVLPPCCHFPLSSARSLRTPSHVEFAETSRWRVATSGCHAEMSDEKICKSSDPSQNLLARAHRGRCHSPARGLCELHIGWGLLEPLDHIQHSDGRGKQNVRCSLCSRGSSSPHPMWSSQRPRAGECIGLWSSFCVCIVLSFR